MQNIKPTSPGYKTLTRYIYNLEASIFGLVQLVPEQEKENTWLACKEFYCELMDFKSTLEIAISELEHVGKFFNDGSGVISLISRPLPRTTVDIKHLLRKFYDLTLQLCEELYPNNPRTSTIVFTEMQKLFLMSENLLP